MSTILITPSATLLSKKTVGYNFKQAKVVNQVKKSKTPTLFIHGNQDHFVPTYMALELYNACQAEKKLLIVNDAAHGESIIKRRNLFKVILLISREICRLIDRAIIKGSLIL